MVIKKIKIRLAKKHAFTLVELMLTITISIILLLGIGAVLADAAKGWNQMYERVHGQVADGAYVAANTFEAIVRKSSSTMASLDSAGQFVNVYYYPTGDLYSVKPTKYAWFYKSGATLQVDYGNCDPNTSPPTTTKVSTNTLANNVTSVFFSIDPGSTAVRMVLVLDDNKHSITVTSSAIRNNP